METFEAGGGLAMQVIEELEAFTCGVHWPICETVLHKEPKADFSRSVGAGGGGSINGFVDGAAKPGTGKTPFRRIRLLMISS